MELFQREYGGCKFTVLHETTFWFVLDEVCAFLELPDLNSSIFDHVKRPETFFYHVETDEGLDVRLYVNSHAIAKLVELKGGHKAVNFKAWVIDGAFPSLWAEYFQRQGVFMITPENKEGVSKATPFEKQAMSWALQNVFGEQQAQKLCAELELPKQAFG